MPSTVDLFPWTIRFERLCHYLRFHLVSLSTISYSYYRSIAYSWILTYQCTTKKSYFKTTIKGRRVTLERTASQNSFSSSLSGHSINEYLSLPTALLSVFMTSSGPKPYATPVSPSKGIWECFLCKLGSGSSSWMGYGLIWINLIRSNMQKFTPAWWICAC